MFAVCVVCVRVTVVDCGDTAAAWLSSVVSIENVRLVRHERSDDQCKRL